MMAARRRIPISPLVLAVPTAFVVTAFVLAAFAGPVPATAVRATVVLRFVAEVAARTPVAAAVADQMPALALTDHGCMFGAWS